MNKNRADIDLLKDVHLPVSVLKQYLSGECTPAESHRIEKHLLHCPACQELLHGVEQAGGPVAFGQDISRLRLALRKKHQRKRVTPTRAMLGAAASVLLVTSFFLFFFPRLQQEKETSNYAMQEPAMEQADETLPETLAPQETVAALEKQEVLQPKTLQDEAPARKPGKENPVALSEAPQPLAIAPENTVALSPPTPVANDLAVMPAAPLPNEQAGAVPASVPKADQDLAERKREEKSAPDVIRGNEYLNRMMTATPRASLQSELRQKVAISAQLRNPGSNTDFNTLEASLYVVGGWDAFLFHFNNQLAWQPPAGATPPMALQISLQLSAEGKITQMSYPLGDPDPALKAAIAKVLLEGPAWNNPQETAKQLLMECQLSW